MSNKANFLVFFLKTMGAPITEQTVIEESKKYTHFPSFISIGKMLKNLGITSNCYSLDFDELKSITLPCITQLDNGFVVITAVNNTYAVFRNDLGKKGRLYLDDFQNQFRGLILTIDESLDREKKEYNNKRLVEFIEKLRMPFFIFSLTCLFLLIYLLHAALFVIMSFPVVMLLLLKAIGITITILILRYELLNNETTIRGFCRNQECHHILSSSASKLTKNLSWAEVGLFYFSSTWLALLFNPETGLLQILVFFNTLCLPYTVFSVYYQWSVAKKYCILCLAIQSILWGSLQLSAILEAIICLSSTYQKWAIRYFAFQLSQSFGW